MAQSIQIRSAGKIAIPRTDRTSFWQLSLGGKVVGWARGYHAAVQKAEALELELLGKPQRQAAA